MADRLPLVFVGRLTLEDVNNIRRYHDRLRCRLSIQWTAQLLAGMLMALCVWVTYFVGLHPIGLVFLSVLLCVFVSPWLRRWDARRHYCQHPEEYLETRVTIAEDRIQIENEAIRSEFGWRLLGVVCNTPRGLLFCDRVWRVLFWLPEHLLDDEVRAQLLALTVQNNVQVKPLR